MQLFTQGVEYLNELTLEDFIIVVQPSDELLQEVKQAIAQDLYCVNFDLWGNYPASLRL